MQKCTSARARPGEINFPSTLLTHTLVQTVRAWKTAWARLPVN